MDTVERHDETRSAGQQAKAAKAGIWSQAEQDEVLDLMLSDIDLRLASISRHTDALLASYNLA